MDAATPARTGSRRPLAVHRRSARVADYNASPCALIDPGTGLCAGCLRTLDEIAAWSAIDDDARRAIVAKLPSRRAASVATPVTPADGGTHR
ncbi:MAG: DUF1289 domain-containing protein [Betaproteobacteria bacterium]|nr:DUF1289 domain-containing protein [Betaproteobacteria bacterium]